MNQSSEPASDNIDRRIAERLKARRTMLGLSLDELAQRSGVSRAMISKVERCVASPTAALLGRLCGGLAISLSSLMTSAEQAGVPVARVSEQAVWRDPATGLYRRAISPANTGSEVEIAGVMLPAGASVSYPAGPHPHSEQHILVLEGMLSLNVGNQSFSLATGDCLYMRLGEPLVFANHQAAACRYLVILRKAPFYGLVP